MNRAEEVDRLVQSKNWNQLTRTEQEMVLHELGSETKFNELRMIGFLLENTPKAKLHPDPEILSGLKTKFRAKHGKHFNIAEVLEFRLPGYATLFLLLIAISAAWYLGRNSAMKNDLAQPVIKKDTVYIATKSDTIFLNKIVYKTIYKTRPAETISLTSGKSETESQNVGVNMKEKSELDNLLVTGSE